MSVTFYTYTREGESYRLPTRRIEFPNFNNRNAADMLNELGFGAETMWDCDPVAIDLFEQACVLARAGFDGKPAGGLQSGIREGRIVVIEGGRPEGYFNRRVDELLEMVARGRADGATHVGWG